MPTASNVLNNLPVKNYDLHFIWMWMKQELYAHYESELVLFTSPIYLNIFYSKMLQPHRILASVQPVVLYWKVGLNQIQRSQKWRWKSSYATTLTFTNVQIFTVFSPPRKEKCLIFTWKCIRTITYLWIVYIVINWLILKWPESIMKNYMGCADSLAHIVYTGELIFRWTIKNINDFFLTGV